MPTSPRQFRTRASLEAEAVTRDAIRSFLETRGFAVINDERRVAGNAVSQAVTARTSDGEVIKMRVRLCWRRDGRKHRERAYSAAQLRARLIDKDWDRTLRFIVERDKEQGNTHTLIVQYEDSGFVYAALIPRDDLMPIWQRQRDISADLIASRKLGRITKNHAMNGSSPTIWLHDNREQQARAVADALWSWPGVVNLVGLPVVATSPTVGDDTFDDCPIDYSQLGRDGGTKVEQTRSGYPRDPKVRSKVIRRAAGSCERENCNESRNFPGFLDVHHILGVGTSDRVWNCVALCPNCHRDAHFAPEREAINTTLRAAVQKKLSSLE